MSGFDLPPLSGFERSPLQRLPLRETTPPNPSLQDPERVGSLPVEHPGESNDLAKHFGGVLADSLADVAALQADVQQKTRGLALGDDVELHDVLLAAGKSEVAFNLLLEVRNKLVDAWEKLSRSAV
jgi:flagellar hook-basal body complex protein FliE